MTDKTIVLITGANTGLGYQIVRALYSSDKAYEILLGGRSIEKAQQATQDVEAEFSSSKSHIETVQIDIEDDQSIQNLREHIKSKFGRLDVLVNNAGLSPLNSERVISFHTTCSSKLTTFNRHPDRSTVSCRKNDHA